MGKSKELAELGQVVSQSGGNVGVGITPVERLAVDGNVFASTGDGGGFLLEGNSGIFRQGITAMGFNTNGAERMRIDASGRVTMPYQPAFHAYATSDRGFSHTPNTWTTLGGTVFNETLANTGNSFNTSSGAFTCPVSGVYCFYFNLREETYYGSWGDIQARLVRNGALIGQVRKWDGYQTEETLALQVITSCSANDVLQVEVFLDSTDTSLSVEGSYCTFFGGYLIG